MRAAIRLTLALGMLAVSPRPAAAQLNGLNIKGDVGLGAGTQSPPRPYYGVLFHRYGSDTIKDVDGNQINAGDGSLTQWVFAPLLNVVTKQRFLGGYYGFAVVPPFLNMSIEQPGFDHDPGAGLGDIYVQPVNLGWHLRAADVMAGYAFFAPTGRYTKGAADNTSLDMWAQEFTIGTTVFLDPKRTMDVSTLAAFEFHDKKRHSEAQVGTLLTMEGGFALNFAGGVGKAGVVYAAQWKLTDDTLTGLPPLLVRGRNNMLSVGPEVTLPLVTTNSLLGFLTFRYEWEVYAHTTTQGNTLIVSAAFPFKPLRFR